MAVKHFANFFSLLLYISAAVCFIANRIQRGQSMSLLGAAVFAVAVLNGLARE
jgi:sodium/potassium-transporting ATPase subunit alpha